MKYEQEVISWATARGIFDKATKDTQWDKTQEEVIELVLAIDRNSAHEAKDAIGDIIVTLVIQAKMWGFSIDECVEAAYNEIKGRTGIMQNGIFIKD